MESKVPEQPIDIAEMQKEVIEMRQVIPDKYRAALEKDFKDFKRRLTNIVAQSRSIKYSESENPAINMSVFDSKASQHYDVEDLSLYIHNAEMFVSKVKEIRDKSKI